MNGISWQINPILPLLIGGERLAGNCHQHGGGLDPTCQTCKTYQKMVLTCEIKDYCLFNRDVALGIANL